MAGVLSGDPEIKAENITEYRSLRRGDQIAVDGEMAGVDYYHHGIFLGHEEGVADFGGLNKRDAKPRIVDLLQFTENGNRQLVRILHKEAFCLPPEEVANIAINLVTYPNQWGKYHLLKNNCEHFAMKCKTGVAASEQVIEKLRNCLTNPITAIQYAVASSKYSSGSISG